MFWTKKSKLRQALKANKLIHDAIVMSIADKYIQEENLENNAFGLQLLGRALNWAIPDLSYDFDKDLEAVEDEEIKRKLKENEDQIFIKGLDILNSDSVAETLITYYVSYEIYLIDALLNEDEKSRYPGLVRMRKFIFQCLDQEPDVMSPDFLDKYKELFIKFNNKYGEYGKLLKKETIDLLFVLYR